MQAEDDYPVNIYQSFVPAYDLHDNSRILRSTGGSKSKSKSDSSSTSTNSTKDATVDRAAELELKTKDMYEKSKEFVSKAYN